jgi:hypothetical protein
MAFDGQRFWYVEQDKKRFASKRLHLASPDDLTRLFLQPPLITAE